MRSPLIAIAKKEFIQIRRDRATIYMVFIFPVMMLILYGFGIRYDVRSVPMTVFDRDGTQDSRQSSPVVSARFQFKTGNPIIITTDLEGRILAIGFVGLIAAQVLMNLGSNVALIPLTGVPLPFISYGGSSLFVVLSSIGILLNIKRQS